MATSMNIYTHTCIYIHIDTLTHMYTHTYTYIHTRTHFYEFRIETKRIFFWLVSVGGERSLLRGFHLAVSWKCPRNGGDMQGEDC